MKTEQTATQHHPFIEAILEEPRWMIVLVSLATTIVVESRLKVSSWLAAFI